MGPHFAAESFRGALPEHTTSVRVTLYGSLAATGRGHLTDVAVSTPFAPLPVDIDWRAAELLPRHPNGMRFEALGRNAEVLAELVVYSVGGGALLDADGRSDGGEKVYPFVSLQEVLAQCDRDGLSLWEIVLQFEGPGFQPFLAQVWAAMKATIARGLNAEGKLPGSLNVPRKAAAYHARAASMAGYFGQTALLFSYALAVSEENASGREIVTAPTCGACGVLPSVLFFLQGQSSLSDDKICRALATAGLVGNMVKRNASISGAEVGCQGEVGVACSMAAAGLAELLGGSPEQVCVAAEIGMEHNLGLTCDPVAGQVQVPCIERNAIASVKAINAARMALRRTSAPRVSLDKVIETMYETGKDMNAKYRETSRGGLAIKVQCD